MLLQKQDGTALSYSERGITIESAINGTNIMKIEKEIGVEPLIVSLTFLISRTADNFNVPYNEQKAMLLAFDIIEKYKYETLEDFILIFKKGRQGEFSDGFDKLRFENSLVLGTWIPKYLEQKAKERELLQKKQQTDLSGIAKDKEFQNLKQKFCETIQKKEITKTTTDKMFEENIKENCKDWDDVKIKRMMKKYTLNLMPHHAKELINILEAELKSRA